MISGVLVNGGERQCFREGKGDKCVPDAAILPGGAGASLMPGISLRRGSDKRPGPGRVYLLRFNGTATGTGLSCTGFAAVCVIEQPRNLRGQPPPSCQPFLDAWTVRVATRCNGDTMTLAAAAKALDEAP